MMAMLRRTATLGSILAILTISASVAQECSPRLLDANVTINTSDKRSRTYLRDVMCSLDVDEFKKKYGADTGMEYMKIVSGKGNFTWSRRSRSMCSTTRLPSSSC
jgi:hypothetical protein